MSELLLTSKSDLAAIADKIKAKAGVSGGISFPQGFLDTVDKISGQGGSSSGSSSGGSASLNIHYGDTAPSDTSMLWCKCAKPNNVVVSTNIGQLPMTINNIVTCSGSSYYMHCVKVGGYLYLFPRTSSYKVQKYDLETGVVTPISTSLPGGLANIYTVYVAFDNNIYCFNSDCGCVCLFDTTTESFTDLKEWTLSGVIKSSAFGIYDNKIYFVGGYKSTSISVFDLETKQCSIISAKFPDKLYSGGYACLGSKIYVFGGYYYDSSSNKGYRNSIRVFDCETQTVTTLATTLPTKLAYMGSVTLGTKIYLVGGRITDSTESNAIYVFDVESETIETLSITIPEVGNYTGATIDGNDIYYVSDDANLNRFTIQTQIPNGTLHIVPSLNENTFKLIGGNQSVDVGVRNVLLGNLDGYGEKVEAYLYQNDTWIQI